MIGVWAEAESKLDKDEVALSAYSDLMNSLRCVFTSCLALPKDRAITSEVRNALRFISASVKGRGPVAECAKAMLAYAGPNAALQCAQRHAAAGLQDDAATAAFESALSMFVSVSDDVVEDLEAWLYKGNHGAIQIVGAIRRVVDNARKLVAEVGSAVDRWSVAALEHQLEDVDTSALRP